MRPLILAALLFVLIAGVASANHYQGLKWPGSRANNLTVYDATYTPAVHDSIVAAVAEWNKSAVVEMTVVKVAECGVANNAVMVCETASPCEGHWATNLNFKGSKIDKAFVLLKASDCDGSLGDPVSLQIAACHELGHALGLAHQFLPEQSCMVGFDGGPLPNAHDYEMLEAIY